MELDPQMSLPVTKLDTQPEPQRCPRCDGFESEMLETGFATITPTVASSYSVYACTGCGLEFKVWDIQSEIGN